MIKFLHKFFNHDKIDELNRTIDIYKERNQQLEAELREYKGYKLKYKVTKLYVEDDNALLELFDMARKAEHYKRNSLAEGMELARGQLDQGMLAAQLGGCSRTGMAGGLGGSANASQFR